MKTMRTPRRISMMMPFSSCQSSPESPRGTPQSGQRSKLRLPGLDLTVTIFM